MTEKELEELSRELWEKIHRRVEDLANALPDEMSEDELRDLWYRRALELGRAPEERSAGGTLKIVTFLLGRDRYGVDITMVREIQRAEGITAVPTAPDFVVGVMNLRGNILSVVDIRTFFGLPAVTAGPKARILVVEQGDIRVGMLVESVDEITGVNMADIQPPLSPSQGITEDYIEGMVKLRGEMLIIIDLKNVLDNPRLVVEEKV